MYLLALFIFSKDINGGGEESGWMVRIFLSLLAYSHYIASNLSSHIHPFSYSYIQLLLKADEGWRAVSSEGGDIESGEHDVLWMVGLEVLTIEVRICCGVFWYEQNL